MDKSKQALKIYGILFIILGIYDLGMFSLNYFLGDLNEVWNLGMEGIPKSFIDAVVVILFVAMLIMVLIKLFLGIRGIQQSKGTCKGKGHITLAKVILVFTIILIVFSLPGIKLEKDSIIKFLDDLVMISILFDYIRVGKKLINE